VLGRFRPGERQAIEEAIATAIEAVSVWTQQGLEVCMNRYNAGKE
jgi:PTH1 family peptidyl-tRNA hydrolase